MMVDCFILIAGELASCVCVHETLKGEAWSGMGVGALMPRQR